VPVPLAPPGSDWVALGPDALPVDAATAWAAVPHAGAVVVFLGIVRDHADGRDDVTALTYEAYETEAARVMAEIVATTRTRWSDLARVALLHRTGRLELGESAVAVVVSSPHRAAAFDAARFCIDTLKETVPIWKQEHHAGGADWGLGAAAVRPLAAQEGI
jgi:molybdopterin synthase catalytic subunit